MQELLLLKIARLFIEEPYKEFYLREIAKRLKISVFAAKQYADFLVKEGMLKEERRANLRYLSFNSQSLTARYLKISFSIKKIEDSGLIDFLKEKVTNLTSVILFGSIARGEDDKNSDLDLVIIGKSEKIDFSKFNIKINREINAHFFDWRKWNEQFKNNKAFYLDVITQGIALYGEKPTVYGNKNN
ncbi:nucleotidyltransferase domain-containing protein [Candidatus Pacearchaeota archaeon]|nr:nucleotidyltransferase domain-containing protein [Candidatus Pacearchaeota archaeon]